MTIAVDFDGTIVTHEYPNIGKEIPFAVQTLKMLQDDGHKLILWTVREGDLLRDAIQWCREKGLEFYTGNPQDAFPNELDKFRAMMKEEGWDCGQDDEELFELAMHERQYRDYKSGLAKERFRADLEAAKAKAGAPIVVERPVVEMPKFDVDDIVRKYPDAVPVQAPVKGQLLWQYDVDDASTAPAVGTQVEAGEPMSYIQTYYGFEEIIPAISGRIVAVCAKQGDLLAKGEILAFVQPSSAL